MRTIQEKYNAILEGNFSKSQFVKDAKRELPQFISPFNGYEDTVSILKSKGVIHEAKKSEVPEYDKPAPGYSIEALERAVDYELEGMGLMSQETVSEEDYGKAKKKAEKNLKKDPNHYLHLLSGDSKKVDKHDKYIEVKKNNHVDTINGLKKAELKESIQSIKEEIVDVIGLIKSKYPEVSNKDIKDFIKMHFADIQAGADPMEEFKEFLSVNPEILNVDEKKGKDHDGDGDIDSDDYLAAKDKAIKANMAEGRRRKMKGGKVVTENDYETGGYVESMGPMLDKVLKQLIAVWDEWKEGPMTEPAMVPFAKKDLVSYIDSQIIEGEDIVEDTIEENENIKEAFKAIITKVLQEEVITEAATGNLSKIATTYEDFEGMQAAINALENIVTDVESYHAKTKDKIQKVYDSFKDIKNTEGLAVGAMLGPAIEDAFRKDLMPVTEKGFTKGLEMPKVKMLETDGIAEEELEEKETVFKPINEALNAPLEKIGREIYNKFEKAGAFKIKAVTSNPGSLDKYMNPVRKDSSLVAIVGDNTQLYVYTHLDNLQLVQDIIKDLDIKNSIKDAGNDGVYFKSKKPGAIASNGLVVVSLGSGDKVVGENKKYKYTKRQK